MGNWSNRLIDPVPPPFPFFSFLPFFLLSFPLLAFARLLHLFFLVIFYFSFKQATIRTTIPSANTLFCGSILPCLLPYRGRDKSCLLDYSATDMYYAPFSPAAPCTPRAVTFRQHLLLRRLLLWPRTCTSCSNPSVELACASVTVHGAQCRRWRGRRRGRRRTRSLLQRTRDLNDQNHKDQIKWTPTKQQTNKTNNNNKQQQQANPNTSQGPRLKGRIPSGRSSRYVTVPTCSQEV